MTRWTEVRRIVVPSSGPFNYAAAKAAIDEALARGDRVEVEGRALVIRTPVYLRPRPEAVA